METILEINNLTKQYPKFLLDHVSFSMEKGRIMGFIGRNGAGKSTTLKSILNLVHPDAGEISFFGMNYTENEISIKQRLGYTGGAVDYYKKKTIKNIVAVTKTFYRNWDEEAYRHYCTIFELDEDKTPSQLSEGMKVKFNLVIALSHHAELLILDEPTSGLDPISREELLEVFQYLKNQGVSILFSTHITSDLDRCADDITYIRKGKIIASESKEDFIRKNESEESGHNLEDIMIHLEKEALHEKLVH